MEEFWLAVAAAVAEAILAGLVVRLLGQVWTTLRAAFRPAGADLAH